MSRSGPGQKSVRNYRAPRGQEEQRSRELDIRWDLWSFHGSKRLCEAA